MVCTCWLRFKTLFWSEGLWGGRIAAGERCRARSLVKSPFLKEGVLESDTLQPQYTFWLFPFWKWQIKQSLHHQGFEIVRPSVTWWVAWESIALRLKARSVESYESQNYNWIKPQRLHVWHQMISWISWISDTGDPRCMGFLGVHAWVLWPEGSVKLFKTLHDRRHGKQLTLHYRALILLSVGSQAFEFSVIYGDCLDFAEVIFEFWAWIQSTNCSLTRWLLFGA